MDVGEKKDTKCENRVWTIRGFYIILMNYVHVT